MAEPTPTDAELLCLIEAHLGLKPRRDDTVIDPRTGRFTDAQRYRDFARAVLARWGAQPAPADSVLEDAARYDWLFGARTDAQVSSEISTVFNPLPQDEVISHLQGFYMSKSEVNALIDAARKQGANHDNA